MDIPVGFDPTLPPHLREPAGPEPAMPAPLGDRDPALPGHLRPSDPRLNRIQRDILAGSYDEEFRIEAMLDRLAAALDIDLVKDDAR
ncbi:MAG: hypothetical protein WD009_05570 [Phycisphaeraceae bacterium]